MLQKQHPPGPPPFQTAPSFACVSFLPSTTFAFVFLLLSIPRLCGYPGEALTVNSSTAASRPVFTECARRTSSLAVEQYSFKSPKALSDPYRRCYRFPKNFSSVKAKPERSEAKLDFGSRDRWV